MYKFPPRATLEAAMSMADATIQMVATVMAVATICGRRVPVIEVPTMDVLFTLVSCKEMRDAARVAGPKGHAYFGGSRNLRCAKGMIYTHTCEYNNLGLGGLRAGDASAASVIFVVKNIGSWKADGHSHGPDDGGERDSLVLRRGCASTAREKKIQAIRI